MSSDPSAVAGVRARIEAAHADYALWCSEDTDELMDTPAMIEAAFDDREALAAALLAVLDLADDAETVPWPMDYALVSVDDLRAAVVAAFQPKEDETGE